MSHREGSATPSQIWREMTTEQRLVAAQALWADPDSMTQQADAVQAIARQLRFRPQSVLRLAPEKRARHLAALRFVSESLASRALVVYHLAAQRPMLETFLDELGVAHDQGLIKDGVKEPIGAAQLRGAANTLLARFPAGDVQIYLQTLVAQDPTTWGALAPIVSEMFPS